MNDLESKGVIKREVGKKGKSTRYFLIDIAELEKIYKKEAEEWEEVEEWEVPNCYYDERECE